MKEFTIQDKMFLELKEKSIFEKAQNYSIKYLENVFDRNVYPTEEALNNLLVFDETFPENSIEAEKVIELLNEFGNPATVSTLGGRYFGFVCGSALPVAIAAKNLGTYWDQCPTMHSLSPIAAKLESVVEKWLIELFNLPLGTSAGFVSGTTVANLCGLAAARYRILQRKGWDINQKGLYSAPKIRIVTGQAHSSIIKALQLLGFGQENIEWAEVDNQGRIIPESLPELDESTIIILQAGNVNSGSFDPFENICKKAQKATSWVHIDGAFGLWADVVDKLRYLTKGCNMANSWAVDGHKTLNTPYDCGIVLCKDNEALTTAMQTSGAYLNKSNDRDGMYYTPEMSRRARIIELWATMKYLGREGINEMIGIMCDRAKQFAEEISSLNGFFVENNVVFNQVIVSCENDTTTQNVLKNIQELRECWLGGSIWKGKKVIRVSICSWATTEKDIIGSVNSFKEALKIEKTNNSN
ncbi:pyridoxal phosphate-dependent decarboxylase family protein [Aquimarina celericrescens]|uniref:Pyridoxal phosphate-dependent decarboxylase family protein n=1 Tax=Aquimarina celericrescens TaxID=1964542 RepID=A0ABW5ATC5_9FLAO|nr:aspartate aminotransferase family protein [Aquimarina celericrescens]